MELKFDKMAVDTTLAQDYLNTHTELAKLLETDVQKEHTIYLPGTSTTREGKLCDRKDIQPALIELAGKLKENTKLIAQIDYLMRKVPIEDTVAQLNLVVQQVRHVACLTVDEPRSPVLTTEIALNKDSPLLMLGYIAKIYHYRLKCSIYAEDAAAPVCHLFTKLCHDAGLPVVTKLSRSEPNVNVNYSVVPEGSVGVVSEFSDVDSAVDAFVYSSKHVPWSLRKILVQESVYQQFKDALSWKCNLNGCNEIRSTNAADAVEYNGRVFLTDMVGINTPQSAVTVEAYRTRKELKSMLNHHRPYYVSLWANDIAEINDIAHTIQSPVVWVNNFGEFRGPPKISEAVFSHAIFGLFESAFTMSVPKDKQVFELLMLKQSWLTLGRDARLEKLRKALDECFSDEPTNTNYSESKQYLLKMQNNVAQEAFIDVCKEYVCLGVHAPAGELFFISGEFLSVEFLTSLLQGNAFFYRQPVNCERYMNVLRKAGAPVVILEDNVSTGDCKIYISPASTDYTTTTRVIWSNSGTVFAN